MNIGVAEGYLSVIEKHGGKGDSITHRHAAFVLKGKTSNHQFYFPLFINVTTISHILHVSGLGGLLTRQKRPNGNVKGEFLEMLIFLARTGSVLQVQVATSSHLRNILDNLSETF